jgi:hypothetical protein
MTRDPGGDGAAIHVDVPVDDRAVADEDMVGADVTDAEAAISISSEAIVVPVTLPRM